MFTKTTIIMTEYCMEITLSGQGYVIPFVLDVGPIEVRCSVNIFLECEETRSSFCFGPRLFQVRVFVWHV